MLETARVLSGPFLGLDFGQGWGVWNAYEPTLSVWEEDNEVNIGSIG